MGTVKKANRKIWDIFRETQSNEAKISGNMGFFLGMSPKNSRRYPRFLGGPHGSAQTVLLRTVTPRVTRSILNSPS